MNRHRALRVAKSLDALLTTCWSVLGAPRRQCRSALGESPFRGSSARSAHRWRWFCEGRICRITCCRRSWITSPRCHGPTTTRSVSRRAVGCKTHKARRTYQKSEFAKVGMTRYDRRNNCTGRLFSAKTYHIIITCTTRKSRANGAENR